MAQAIKAAEEAAVTVGTDGQVTIDPEALATWQAERTTLAGQAAVILTAKGRTLALVRIASASKAEGYTEDGFSDEVCRARFREENDMPEGATLTDAEEAKALRVAAYREGYDGRTIGAYRRTALLLAGAGVQLTEDTAAAAKPLVSGSKPLPKRDREALADRVATVREEDREATFLRLAKEARGGRDSLAAQAKAKEEAKREEAKAAKAAEEARWRGLSLADRISEEAPAYLGVWLRAAAEAEDQGAALAALVTILAGAQAQAAEAQAKAAEAATQEAPVEALAS
jgi:hypothetical protein